MDKLYLDLLKVIFNKLDFLSQIRFRQISKLHYSNLHIIDLYHIHYKYLELLNDEILKNYPYIEFLNAFDNRKIKNIDHMKNLKILNCSHLCGISDENIKGLDLTKLYTDFNPKIKNIGHMKNLKVLYCGGNCGIADEDIKDLDLRELYCSRNPKIKNMSYEKFKNVILWG